jgi:predicted hydrocarbon binding protein/KaiC/GvpD/RAD55 family RecA-like ATPase
LSLSQIQDAPAKNIILLFGPPGSGKSDFCHQTVLNTIQERPVIYLTTESPPTKIAESLREKGLGEMVPYPISFIDAFHQTVGLTSETRLDTIGASAEDLTSLSIAISKLRKNIKEGFLLIFDSLTSPYLMTGQEILRFMRKTLLRLAAEGNAVLVCMDEGCGKEEDLVAMMSSAHGIVKIELHDGSKTFNVIKHPKVKPKKIETPMTYSPEVSYDMDWKILTQHIMMSMNFLAGRALRTEVGDYVNVFWLNLARWSGLLWDPKRFPRMTYNLSKDLESRVKDFVYIRFPWRVRLYFKLFMPKNFDKVKGMKKLTNKFTRRLIEGDRTAIIEYLEDASKTGEHYMRLHERAQCWGFENVGATLALGTNGVWAGMTKSYDKEHRDWNIVETKCIGLGDPYCVNKIVPGEIDELKDSLESIDFTVIEKINDRLMDQLIGFIFNGNPLWERPRLGNEVSLHSFWFMIVVPALASERYRMAMRLGGAIGGKKVGEYLMDKGVSEDEAVKHLLDLMEYCKVGKVSIGKTVRIKENCESFMVRSNEPFCSFTTGFLNGFFSVVKNQHVKETKCVAVGNPHCEWEFR